MSLALVGCGRLEFSPLPLRGDGGDGDSGDTSDAGPCTWSAFSMPTRLQGAILSGFDDWMATPTLGETRLYFHSYRTTNSDLYVATRPTPADQFGTPTVIGELMTIDDQWTPTLTEDALVILYGDGELGPLHLKIATRGNTDQPFGAPIDVPVIGGTAVQQDKSPFLSPDGLRVMFTSNRSGQDEIYESTRLSRSANFSLPVKLDLGAGFARDNTASADGLEVFFISDRPGSLALDVWTARRPAIGQPFSTPTRVPELSSSRDDTGVRLSVDGRTMYLNYDTLTAGGGQADIYTATRTCM